MKDELSRVNPSALTHLWTTAQPQLIDIGLKVAGALVLWVLGRLAIATVLRLVNRSTDRSRIDPTLARYVRSMVSVLLQALLILAVLGVFGVQTTTFAGLLAAAGVAIGMAWSGLLSNFAAGLFLVMLRPFKVGDAITGGGVSGTVAEIGLFSSGIDTADNVRTYVGNSKLLGDSIQNYSANATRRIEILLQVGPTVDIADATHRIKAVVTAVPEVLASPAPFVDIVDPNLLASVIAIRVFCRTERYGDVASLVARAVKDECVRAHIVGPAAPAPMPLASLSSSVTSTVAAHAEVGRS